MRNPITQYGKPVTPFFMLGEHYGRKTIETWRDATTPRTDRPVRFIPSNRYRQTPPAVKWFPGDSFTIRWA